MTMRCFIIRFLRLKLVILLFMLLTVFILFKQNEQSRKHIFSNSSQPILEIHKPKQANRVNFLQSAPSSHVKKTVFVPGIFLKNEIPKNESYCNYNYRLPYDLNTTELFLEPTPELGDQGPYKVIYSITEGYYDDINGLGVTYCTHATPEFLYHVVEIAHRWDGPVSVSVFAPGIDIFLSLTILYHMCRCLPEMSKVSVHLVVYYKHIPSVSEFVEANNNLTHELGFSNCSAPINLLNGNIKTFRHQNNLTYPVNIARNVARVRAKTSHVLVSDVELLPSSKLVPAFINMFEKFEKKLYHLGPSLNSKLQFVRHVFVLPVFEIDESVLSIPSTKGQLLDLYTQNRAVYFHRWVCLHCQRFPGLEKWLQKKSETDDATLIQVSSLSVAFYTHTHAWNLKHASKPNLEYSW